MSEILPSRQRPASAVQKIDIARFLTKPRTNYAQLIQKNEKESALMELAEYAYHQSDPEGTVYRSYGNATAGSLLGIQGYELRPEFQKSKERTIEFLKQKLRGRIVVGLGAGKGKNMKLLMKECDVHAYISVDRWYGHWSPQVPSIDLLELPPDPLKEVSERLTDLSDEERERNEEARTHIVKSDMLDFLSRVPDESVCVEISGIDEAMVNEKKYHCALSVEIARVLQKGGIAFGSGSLSLSHIERFLEDSQYPEIDDVIKKELESSNLKMVNLFESLAIIEKEF